MKKLILLSLGFLSASLSFAADPQQAAKLIQADRILDHIKILASDDFEGRAPGTKGEAMSVEYITDQFKKLKLSPGNSDGTYRQGVPLVGFNSTPSMSYEVGGKTVSLKSPDDFVAFAPGLKPELSIKKSDIVFVGYGVVAPEYGWDDYKGVDLKGKTILMLINDPAIPDPKNPGKLDPKMFKGEEMTYYGRWTYKYEMAAARGAAAAIIIHETIPAAYPFEVVKNSMSHENFEIQSDGPNPDFPSVASWIQLDRAKELFKSSGLDFEDMKKAALSKDFKPITLKARVDIQVKNVWRSMSSSNVVAKIEGSDPKLKDEYVIYSAHWDHFGMDEKLPGPKTNQIFHGAADNASGVATILEIARAYKSLNKAPKRSILFMATTAEERGLLGARYYARNPLYPLQKTLADINIDVINLWGRTHDIGVSGFGKSSIDEIVMKAAKNQKREAVNESRPELGTFYRADHFEFAKEGVPGLYTRSGSHFIGKPESYAREKVDEFVAHNYHKVSDIVRSDWDLSGGVEDAQVLFLTGYDIAQGKKFPVWKEGTEFKAKREQSMSRAAKID